MARGDKALRKSMDKWDELGARDGRWAALTDGQWSSEDFLATGESEIRALLARLETLGVPPRLGTAVDFGCGPGRLTRGLAVAGFEQAVGVDASQAMIELAREDIHLPNCRFVVNDRPDLRVLDDASADLVYTARVLQHIPTATAHAYIAEFFRVVRPGGVVVFQVPSHPVAGAVGTAIRLLPAVATLARKGMQMHGTKREEVARLVASAGGRVVDVSPDDFAGPRWVSFTYVCQRDG